MTTSCRSRSVSVPARADGERSSPSETERSLRTTRRFGRVIYLGIVLALFLYLASIFVGPLLFLRADGMVTSDRFVVGAAYTARVIRVDIKPGDRVIKGQPLLALD